MSYAWTAAPLICPSPSVPPQPHVAQDVLTPDATTVLHHALGLPKPVVVKPYVAAPGRHLLSWPAAPPDVTTARAATESGWPQLLEGPEPPPEVLTPKSPWGTPITRHTTWI